MTEADELEKMRQSFEVISRMSQWWIDSADSILERIKTDTTEDVMLYHDAVSVLVSARNVFEIANMHVGKK